MITDSVIQTVKLESDTVYYVYYNEWDGSIHSITSTMLEDSELPFIETSDFVAKNIMMGFENEKKYLVTFNTDTHELELKEKDNVLRLRSSETTLIQVPQDNNPSWDIKIRVYLGNSKLQVEINSDSIRRLSNMTFNKSITVSEQSDLTLYITEFNNPDYFIQKIDIDPIELLTEGNVVIDISHIRKYISLKNIGVLTRRCFKNYTLEFISESLSLVQSSLIKNKSYIHRSVYKDLPGAHITLEQQSGGIITYRTKLSSNELNDLGLHEDTMYLNIVGDTPDEYFQRIPLNVRELKNRKRTSIRVEGDLYNFNILHKKHRLVFSIRNI